MNDIKNGGPAFPVYDDTHMYPTSTGMTLRDWFAGQALAGLSIANLWDKQEDMITALAYRAADAMLAAREKGGEE